MNNAAIIVVPSADMAMLRWRIVPYGGIFVRAVQVWPEFVDITGLAGSIPVEGTANIILASADIPRDAG